MKASTNEEAVMPINEFHESNWAEDVAGLSFDELRELPAGVQMGIDLSIFD